MGKLLKLALAEHRRRGTLLAAEYPVGAALHLATVCLVFDHHLVEPGQTRPAQRGAAGR